MKTVRHHLLEYILWPCADGTFKEIRNSVERLRELGVYRQFKLCIKMTRGEHGKLHYKGRPKSEEQKQKQSAAMKGKPSHWKGKTRSAENRAKISATAKKKQQAKSALYREYKALGGTLGWNDWCKARKKGLA